MQCLPFFVLLLDPANTGGLARRCCTSILSLHLGFRSCFSMEKLIVSNDTFFEEVIALLREGKKVTVPAKGESMLPFIVGGVDSVVLEGVDGGSPTGTVLKTANVGDHFLVSGLWIPHPQILAYRTAEQGVPLRHVGQVAARGL